MPSFLELADTGRSTTRLGFGCSGLMGSVGRKASLRLLEVAYEAGIRHFDVAPMYGDGEAEVCLGEFIARHGGDITVTTKFGIPPGKNQLWMHAAKLLARSVLSYMPKTGERIRKTSSGRNGGVLKLPFTAVEGKASLERSLRNLRTDRIDLWLLHEATASDLQDDSLLRFMEDAVNSGKVGTFGVGSEGQHIRTLQAERPRYCRVLQFEWSVFDKILPNALPFRVHHRSLTESFRARYKWLVNQPTRCESWSEVVGRNLREPSELASLMLRASLDCNPQSIVLFSSRSPEHIHENVRISEDQSLRKPALSLQELAHRESFTASYS